MTFQSSGKIRLPLTWRAVRIEQHEHGTIIYAERRGLLDIIAEAVERIVDRYEDAFRRNVWPYLWRR